MIWIEYAAIALVVTGATLLGIRLKAKIRAALFVRRPGDKALDYAVRANWSGGGRKVNFSSFIYFDIDRDGRYGPGDKPLGGMHVRLYRDDRHLRRSVSNINGFANFVSSKRLYRAPIRKAGTYRFEVSVPPGWLSTSDNAVQSAAFRDIPGSPAGIGADAMLQPVGLAPLRLVRGIVGDIARLSIAASGAGGVLASQNLAPGKPFRFVLPDGAETVALAGEGLDNEFRLGSYPVDLGIVGAGRKFLPDSAALQTIGFDDIVAGGLKKVPSGYCGLKWSNLNAMSRDFTPGCIGASNGATSGEHVAYTSSGHPAEIWSDREFGFHSAMLAVAWPQAEGEIACIETWSGQTLLQKDEIVLSAFTPVQYAPMLARVTRIRLSTKHQWQLVIDDLVVAL